MGYRKYDYNVIERAYVAGDMGLRELGRQFGIANPSLLSVQSKKREWVRKREEYRVRAADKAVALMATAEGRRRAREGEVRDNALEAIDEAITKMRSDMKAVRTVFRNNQWVDEPLIVMRAQDIAVLIDRLNVLFGRPANITEERSLGINLSAGGTLGPELLRGIVEATRGLVPGDTGGSPIPRTGVPRKD